MFEQTDCGTNFKWSEVGQKGKQMILIWTRLNL